MTQPTTPDIASILGYNPLDPDFRKNPYPHYTRLREREPVFRTGLGFWMITSYEQSVTALGSDKFGYPRPGELPPGGALPGGFENQRNFFIFMNPPEHTRMRGHVRATLNPKVVHQLRPYVQRAASRALAEAFADSREADLIVGYTHKLPFGTISELLGVPDADRPDVMRWAQLYIDGISPSFMTGTDTGQQRDEALAQLNGYFAKLAAQRRADPQTDMLSELVGIRDRGEMNEDELIGTCVVLFVAGHSTTTNLIGNSIIALLRNPNELDRFLRTDSAQENSAIEELVRYDTPTQMSYRVAFEDVDLGGTVIAKGDQILINRGAANHDPAAFTDPDRLDLGRTDNRHVGFGTGIHVCVGSALARLQARVALATLFREYPDVALATDNFDYHESLVVRGVKTLPVRIGAAG